MNNYNKCPVFVKHKFWLQSVEGQTNSENDKIDCRSKTEMLENPSYKLNTWNELVEGLHFCKKHEPTLRLCVDGSKCLTLK